MVVFNKLLCIRKKKLSRTWGDGYSPGAGGWGARVTGSREKGEELMLVNQLLWNAGQLPKREGDTHALLQQRIVLIEFDLCSG